MSHEWMSPFEYFVIQIDFLTFGVCPLVNLNFSCAKIWFLSSNANILYVYIYVELMSSVSEARVGNPVLSLFS